MNALPETFSDTTHIETEDLNATINGSVGKAIHVRNWGQIYPQPLRVWCLVIALYEEKSLMAIQDTWGRHCDRIFFVVDEKPGQDILRNEAQNTSLHTLLPIKTTVKSKDLWEKMTKMFVYIEQNHHGEYDYILRADIDTWFSVNNFKSYAQYFDPNLRWFMGHTELHEPSVAFNAGGNYAMSRGAVEGLVDIFYSDAFRNGRLTSHNQCVRYRTSWAEDVTFAQCLKTIGIYPVNTMNAQHQLRWSPFSLEYTQKLKWGEGERWYFANRFPGKLVKDCCDSNMIALHNIIKMSGKWVADKDGIYSRQAQDGKEDAFHCEIAQRKAMFEKLDEHFQTGEMKRIPVPERPHTFLFAPTLHLKNRDMMYKLF